MRLKPVIRKTFLVVLLASIPLCLSLSVWAFDDIDLSVTFPAVAQGHYGISGKECDGGYDKQLEQKHNAKINGTEGLDLNFCSSNKDHGDWPADGCDTNNGEMRECSITGRDISGISLSGNNAFKEADSNIEIESCPDGAINLGDNGNSEFEEIKIDDVCSITFSSASQEYRIESLELKKGGELILPSGDYWIEEIEEEGEKLILRPQGDVRIFIGEGHAHLKDFTIAENPTGVTTLVVYDHLELKGDSVVNAFIYANVHVKLKDNAVVNGRVTSGRLKMEQNSIINASQNPSQKLDLKFGKATSHSVIFDTAFDSGVTPIIFLMPTISEVNPDGDGPASVFITQVSNRGFSWSQQEPDSLDDPDGPDNPSLKMPEIHWIATTAGEHRLSDGSYLEAGIVESNKPLYQTIDSYQQVPNQRGYDVVLNQIQKHSNRCWLTSTAKWDRSNLSIGIDVSEVVEAGPGVGYGNKYCQPGDIKLNKLNKEKVAYLAVQSGSGTISITGELIQYQFGSNFSTTNLGGAIDLNKQCGHPRDLLSFTNPPTFVAGKQSRVGNNGGWLRRCQLTNNTVSMVTDEDRYQDPERKHVAERYGFVALEVIDHIPALNHYRISFSSGALSCAAKEMTITACANDNCSTQSDQLSNVELTKNGAKYSDVSFTGHTAPATELWHVAGGSVHVGLGNTAPSAPYRCFIDGAEVALEQCLLHYEDTGFYFDVPNTRSCKTTAEFELFAVTKNTQTQQCQPLFANETKSINFSFDYVRPISVNNPEKLELNSIKPTITTSIAGGESKVLNVSFDSNGAGRLTTNYPEAGVVKLAAQYTHTINIPGGGSETLDLTHTDEFTAAPVGFHFSNLAGSNQCINSDPYDGNCQVLASAGESFSMQVKAVCWQQDGDIDFSDNKALQNFVHPNIAIASDLIEPSSGNNGVLGVTDIDFQLTGSESSEVIDNQSWNEVGTMKLTLAGGLNYESVFIDSHSSDIFGRFTPAYLNVIGNTPTVEHSCGVFTYMDQPFGFTLGAEPSIEVKGYAKDSFDAQNNRVVTETGNYQIGDWWRYKHKDVAAQNRWSGRSYSSSNAGGVLEDNDWPSMSGELEYLSMPSTHLVGAQLNYRRTAIPLAPFDALFDLELAIADVTDEDRICYRNSSTSACRSFTFRDIGQDKHFELRYGRMLLENGYGPESESLRLPLRTEYVSTVSVAGDATWVTNRDDFCSIYNTQTSTDTTEMATTGLYMIYPVEFPAINAYSDSSLNQQQGTLASGVDQLYFSIPNTAGEVPLKQHVQPWLKWFWNYDGNHSNLLYDPRASAYFGTYRGHDKVIYWREVN